MIIFKHTEQREKLMTIIVDNIFLLMIRKILKNVKESIKLNMKKMKITNCQHLKNHDMSRKFKLKNLKYTQFENIIYVKRKSHVIHVFKKLCIYGKKNLQLRMKYCKSYTNLSSRCCLKSSSISIDLLAFLGSIDFSIFIKSG